jgi:hypothetical protein
LRVLFFLVIHSCLNTLLVTAIAYLILNGFSVGHDSDI